MRAPSIWRSVTLRGSVEENDVAHLLGRIERLLEDAVEGTSRRLFRAELQPVELAKAASRTMQQQQVIGPEGPSVPNRYRIRLHPGDYDRFAPYRQSLERKIVAYLEQFAADRNLQPIAPWRVDLTPDEDVRSGRVSVTATMADEIASVALAEHADQGPQDSTAAVDLSQSFAGVVTLVGEDGRRFPLRNGATRVGRALDNDVVIADSRVSRYHAEVMRTQDGRGYILHDLGSTNGTSVGGRPAKKHRLEHGDKVSLGGYTLAVRLGSAGD